MKMKVDTAKLAALAGAADQARRWKARRNGLLDRGAPSEVRDLSGDATARAEAEASLLRAMTPASKRCWRR